MNRLDIRFFPINEDISRLMTSDSFAVLLDAGDQEWRDEKWLGTIILKLLEDGCKYFVCFGENSEALHDSIDDVLLDFDASNVVTTFHSEESKSEIAEFFKNVAMNDLPQGLVIVGDVLGWRDFFINTNDF